MLKRFFPLFFLLFVTSAYSQIVEFNNTVKTVKGDPNYAALSNVLFHHRAEGLVINTTNAAGVVSAGGDVTKIISMDPFITGAEFDANGTSPTLSSGAIVYGGAGRHRHNGLNSYWNNLHHRATITDLKATVHGVFKFGTTANPNAVYGILGNYAGSSANKGFGAQFDDRNASNLNKQLSMVIVKGTSNVFILQGNNNNIIPANEWVHLWLEWDKSKDQTDECVAYINGKKHTLGVRVDNETTVITPNFAMEIGGLGNAIAPAVMEIKEITIQQGVESDQLRSEFIRDVMKKYGIQPKPFYTDNIHRKEKFTPIYDVVNDAKYYLPISMAQDPTDLNTIVALMHESVAHTHEPNGIISMRKSTDRGRTWGAKTTVLDPAGDEAPMSVAVGYSSDGTLRAFIDTHTTEDATSVNKLYYYTSTNDGTSWSSADITSSLPSDGLATYRMDQHIIENDGVLMCGFYKVTAEGDATESANYLFRSTDSGTTWPVVTIRAKSATYRNEGSTVSLSTTGLLHVVRDEVTGEWHQYKSTNNGANWTDQGALALAEAFSRESPPLLTSFLINGTKVIVMYYSDRDRDQLRAVYATAPALEAGGVADWKVFLKYVLTQGSSDFHHHYGDVIHINNDIEGVAMWPYDAFPATGAGTDNIIHTFKSETVQYLDVKAKLGL